jgi:hypothetical protein
VLFKAPEHSKAQVSGSKALRHLMVFQLKLAADALRDLVLSPLSLVVFVVDAIRKPALEDSLYLRLMLLGRRSDQLINLFDEHRDAGHFTVDEAVDELERVVRGAKDASRPDAPSMPADDESRQ